ncbi:hypothetical protein FA13DRAFT_1414457 [Coprinellus micaceus]|uniref:Uncharacterized protein n=1 Tax=Coprinellus micaceus TaxID=71717 RepID=A0A4Y7SNK4_COPMI|nr:hypothetical protein FA13DRAFT_1414457 [Coprinellus micaceus]
MTRAVCSGKLTLEEVVEPVYNPVHRKYNQRTKADGGLCIPAFEPGRWISNLARMKTKPQSCEASRSLRPPGCSSTPRRTTTAQLVTDRGLAVRPSPRIALYADIHLYLMARPLPRYHALNDGPCTRRTITIFKFDVGRTKVSARGTSPRPTHLTPALYPDVPFEQSPGTALPQIPKAPGVGSTRAATRSGSRLKASRRTKTGRSQRTRSAQVFIQWKASSTTTHNLEPPPRLDPDDAERELISDPASNGAEASSLHHLNTCLNSRIGTMCTSHGWRRASPVRREKVGVRTRDGGWQRRVCGG